MDEGHYLAPFLEERLPNLGLDAEAYGAYLLGLLPSDDITLIDDEGYQGADEEEWDGVLELLQASSETHSDDENAWKELKKDVLQKHEEHMAILKEQKAAEEAKRQEAIKTPVISIPEAEEKKAVKKNTSIDEKAKKDLLARFAYENDDDENEGTGDVPAPVIDNKAAAQQANLEKARELRNQKVTTKKDEQMKTKQAKLDKQKAKEERRQRATKSERKR